MMAPILDWKLEGQWDAEAFAPRASHTCFLSHGLERLTLSARQLILTQQKLKVIAGIRRLSISRDVGPPRA